MTKLSSFQQTGQKIDQDTLKAAFATRDLFSRNGYLAKKMEPKSYTEANRSAYHFNFVGIGLSHFARIAAGFAAVFFFVHGMFSAFGTAADFIAGIVAIVLLSALEIRQFTNTTQFWEGWFFQKKFDRSRLGWAGFFSVITLLLSISGLPHSVAYISKNVTAHKAELLDVEKETATLAASATAATEEAEKFRRASQWQGRLSDSDRKKYNQLLAIARDARNQYEAARLETKQENQRREDAAHDQTAAAVAAKDARDNRYTWILGLILVFTELLFWFCFLHKERFEFFEAMEKRELGLLHVPTPPTGNGAKKQRQTAHDFDFLEPDLDFSTAKNQAAFNRLVSHVTQPPQTVTQPNGQQLYGSADDYLKAAKRQLAADFANLKNGNGNQGSVVGRLKTIFRKVDETTALEDFVPTPAVATDFKNYAYEVIGYLTQIGERPNQATAIIEKMKGFALAQAA